MTRGMEIDDDKSVIVTVGDRSCSRWIYKTFLISSNSVDLLGLLNWRSNTERLEEILQKLMEVDGGEIIKVRL